MLKQICETLIPYTFYEDYLKRFRLCKGYLVSSKKYNLPVY
jgi:hypothetical protein